MDIALFWQFCAQFLGDLFYILLTIYRRYTNLNRIHEKLATLDVLEMEFNDILRANCEDTIAMEDVIRWLPSHAYEFGYNAHLGDNMATTLLWGDKSNLRKLQRQFKYNWFFPVAEKSLLERASLLKGETSLTQLKKSNWIHTEIN